MRIQIIHQRMSLHKSFDAVSKSYTIQGNEWWVNQISAIAIGYVYVCIILNIADDIWVHSQPPISKGSLDFRSPHRDVRCIPDTHQNQINPHPQKMTASSVLSPHTFPCLFLYSYSRISFWTGCGTCCNLICHEDQATGGMWSFHSSLWVRPFISNVDFCYINLFECVVLF